MRELPDGGALLDIARQVLRTDLMDALPPAQRHLALMVANAMAIAQRELAQGEQGLQRELAALAGLMASPDGPGGGDAEARLLPLYRLLAGAIRSGMADPGTQLHPKLRAMLLDASLAKVAVSNPKYLGAAS